MIPSPSDLTYFLEVADLLNLSRAAERLGISQPSLTLAMRRLEECVGAAIIIRHKKGVSLTKPGKQLWAHTHRLMQEWDTIRSATLASQHEVQGSVTFGCHPSVALFTLPKFFPDLLEKNPNLEIKLKHSSTSRRVTEQVISMEIDIAISVNPIRHPDLIIKKLMDDKITLWHNSQIRPMQDINSAQSTLIYDPELLQTQYVLKKLKHENINFAKIIPSNSLELIAELTAAGCGIGILPGGIAIPRKLQMVEHAPFYSDEICLLYHGNNRDIKSIQVIAAAVKAAFMQDSLIGN